MHLNGHRSWCAWQKKRSGVPSSLLACPPQQQELAVQSSLQSARTACHRVPRTSTGSTADATGESGAEADASISDSSYSSSGKLAMRSAVAGADCVLKGLYTSRSVAALGVGGTSRSESSTSCTTLWL